MPGPKSMPGRGRGSGVVRGLDKLLFGGAGQDDLIESFRQGNDVYSEFATDVYGRTITKADKVERHVGKTCILGLGYGMGANKFQHTLATGFIQVHLDEHEAKNIVDLYRRKYYRIAELWTKCGGILPQLDAGHPGVPHPVLGA